MTKWLLIFWILLPLAVLVLASFMMINSVHPQSVPEQGVFLLLGLGLMYLISSIDYRLYTFSPWPWYVLATALLLITLVLGYESRGSTRWLVFQGVTLQTSEFAKPLLILFLSSFLTVSPVKQGKQILTLLALFAVPVGLVMLQPDLGSAIILAALAFIGLIAAGIPFKHVGVLVMSLIVAMPLFFALLQPYQQQRLLSFVSPTADPLGSGYNSAQAMIAIGSGKIFGRGLGQGTQSQLRFLPERHTDFIFASTVEELGFLGGLVIIVAYSALGLALLKVARSAQADNGSIMCLIVMSLILIQAVINIGMNMGMLPITGLTLPFVSVGGSSLISLCIMIGLCLSVARHSKTYPKTLEIK